MLEIDIKPPFGFSLDDIFFEVKNVCKRHVHTFCVFMCSLEIVCKCGLFVGTSLTVIYFRKTAAAPTLRTTAPAMRGIPPLRAAPATSNTAKATAAGSTPPALSVPAQRTTWTWPPTLFRLGRTTGATSGAPTAMS